MATNFLAPPVPSQPLTLPPFPSLSFLPPPLYSPLPHTVPLSLYSLPPPLLSPLPLYCPPSPLLSPSPFTLPLPLYSPPSPSTVPLRLYSPPPTLPEGCSTSRVLSSRCVSLEMLLTVMRQRPTVFRAWTWKLSRN